MTVEDRDERELLELASLIDDDRQVNWDAAERSASDQVNRAVVSELRVLASVTGVHRAAPDQTPPQRSGEEPTQIETERSWGPLTVLEPIGRGAFGTVYRARDSLNREVALKLIDLSVDVDSNRNQRTLDEARLLARIRHPNIVAVYGADRFDGRLGLWMELIRGRTLEEELRARGVFSAEEARLIGLDLCRALAAVHDAGLAHRDVKTRNVMREVGGRIVLMDFGAGAAFDALDRSIDIAGTPLYLAPEIFDLQPASRGSDIYSLGVLLYHLVSGQYPVTGANRIDIHRGHVEGRRTRLRDVRPDLPDGFVHAVECALDPDLRRRYQTVGEFEQGLAGAYGPMRRNDPAGGSEPRPAPRFWMAVAATVVLVTLGAIILGRQFPLGPGAVANPSGTLATGSASQVPATATDAEYTINAAIYKFSKSERIRLEMGDRVAPGDLLGLTIEASRPVHVYVVNEDERGETYLLFPLKGQESMNPLDSGRPHELPGAQAGDERQWQVTSAGGREHFVLFVSPKPMQAFDELLRSLPQPVAGAPIPKARLPGETIDRLRGVGGLVTRPGRSTQSSAHFLFAFAGPLNSKPENVHGVWVRQIWLENPVR